MDERELRAELARESFGARTLYASDVVTIGVTRCGPEHAQFVDPGPVGAHCLLLPESSVLVERPKRRPFASCPNQVVFHPRGQAVRRRAIGRDGDDHTWFALPDGEEVEPFGCALPTATRALPFDDRTWDPRWELVRKALVRELCTSAAPDALWVEEIALALVGAGLCHLERTGNEPPRRPVSSRERDLCERAQHVLRARFREAVTLSELATDVGCSHFHLARVFRRVTGSTLHSYRARLRALAALEAVLAGSVPFRDLSNELGYASPSHFTQSFRRAFAMAPTELVRSWTRDARGLIRELTAELEA